MQLFSLKNKIPGLQVHGHVQFDLEIRAAITVTITFDDCAVIGIIAFSFAIGATRNSAWGLVIGFAFSGFLGVVTGANVNFALAAYSNGGTLVVSAFALTAVLFLGLSAYAMTTKRDFSGWFAFLGVGTLAVFGAFIINYFLAIPALYLALATMIVLLSCGWVL